jgi:enoyl-CoA hydratase/carnithine racemase
LTTSLTNPLAGREPWSAPGIDAAAAGLRLERAGQIVQITLNRPERRNAQRPETWHALDAIGRALPGDVRVVVVTGEGSSFSAGIDLAVLGEMAAAGPRGCLPRT